jgi:predicted ribosome quality control (RQC) complex YloA/Tae2 family protein
VTGVQTCALPISLLLDDREEIKVVSFTSHQQFIDKQIAKFEKKLEQSEILHVEAIEMMSFKDKGDLLYQCNCDLTEKRTDVTINGERIVLDPLKTVNENAQRFYKLYQKAKRTLKHVETQDKNTKELLDLFLEFKTYLSFSNQEQVKDLEKELIEFGYKPKQKQSTKKTVSRPLVMKINNLTYSIYIGKNSTENAYITHELAKKEDYWFHVKDAPGGHIVVSTETLTEEIIRKAAMLAAFYSSMKYSSSIPVDYTQIRNVKKINGKPGYQVTYSKHQTIYIDVDEEKIESYLNKV